MIGSLLVVLAGALTGVATRMWHPENLMQVGLHAQLHWAPFIVIGVGAAITSVTLVQPKRYPGIPSVAVAYGLYVPLTAAGFGLGSGISHLWPDGLVLFAVHLAFATLVWGGHAGIYGLPSVDLVWIFDRRCGAAAGSDPDDRLFWVWCDCWREYCAADRYADAASDSDAFADAFGHACTANSYADALTDPDIYGDCHGYTDTFTGHRYLPE